MLRLLWANCIMSLANNKINSQRSFPLFVEISLTLTSRLSYLDLIKLRTLKQNTGPKHTWGIQHPSIPSPWTIWPPVPISDTSLKTHLQNKTTHHDCAVLDWGGLMIITALFWRYHVGALWTSRHQAHHIPSIFIDYLIHGTLNHTKATQNSPQAKSHMTRHQEHLWL